MAFLVTRHGAGSLSHRQTRRFHAPTRGVRVVNDEWLEEVRAYALVLPPRSAFSHITAADLLNLSLPQEYKQARPLHATTDTSGWPRDAKG